jgi:GntR family transcriptional regulator/MocR family aminotransferase
MIKHTPTLELTGLQLDRSKSTPLHQQIADRIKQAISMGSLSPGARLPSSRSLAAQLSISRATVEFAYSTLAGEGYVSRRKAAGTRVELRAFERNLPPPPSPPRPLMPGLASEASQAPRLFQMGLPALDAFPRKLWSRLAAYHARSLPISKMVYQGTSGFGPLRQAIANHLVISRGIPCSEFQIFITAGFLGALTLIARTLLAPGDKVWIEDPGFPPARHALELAGADLVPVPVDCEGMDISAGIELAPAARLALVTPAVQFPLGFSLSPDRRSQLVSWAAAARAWIVEDDYDSEFSHCDRPVPTLKHLDHVGRVLHVGSFSNVLFPGLRLGYLVAPTALIAEFEQASALLPLQQSLIDQMVLSDFITQGHFGRHLARMRSLYAQRKSALVKALNEVLADSIQVVETENMHVLLRLPANADDLALATQARAQGLAVNALSAMGMRATTGPGLLLGFTNIVPEAAMDAARRLKSALFTPAPVTRGSRRHEASAQADTGTPCDAFSGEMLHV